MKKKTNRKTRRMSSVADRAKAEAKTKRALANAKASVDANLKAIAAADQENATKRDQRAASKDGMTPSERAMADSEDAFRASMIGYAATDEARTLIHRVRNRPMSYAEIAKAIGQPEDRVYRIGNGITMKAQAATLRELIPALRDYIKEMGNDCDTI